MNKLINKFKPDVSLLSFLFGSGVLISMYKSIRNKLLKRNLTSEDANRINENLSDFVEAIYGYFDGKPKKGFEGLSTIEGVGCKLENIFEPKDDRKYPYFDIAKEKIITNTLLPERSYIGNYIEAIIKDTEFFRDKHVVPMQFNKNDKITSTITDSNGNDISYLFKNIGSGSIGNSNRDIQNKREDGTETVNEYAEELRINIKKLKKLIKRYLDKHRQ